MVNSVYTKNIKGGIIGKIRLKAFIYKRFLSLDHFAYKLIHKKLYNLNKYKSNNLNFTFLKVIFGILDLQIKILFSSNLMNSPIDCTILKI